MSKNVLLANGLANLSGIRHAFFTKAHGDGADQSLRTGFERHFSVQQGHLLLCRQIHSAEVVTVTKKWTPDASPAADAMVTAAPGIALGILTADCVPVLLADLQAGVIGAAHAGWRGALSGVLEKTVTAMEKLGATPKNIRAALGACIWQKSYEVSPEFPAPFLAESPANERFFDLNSAGRLGFDLPGYVVAKLTALGVGWVEESPADTCAEPERFFSHRYSTLRKEQRGGSLVSAIALADKESGL